MNPRPHSGRPANDNLAPFDVTALTLKAFGATLLVSLVASTVWLVSVWQ